MAAVLFSVSTRRSERQEFEASRRHLQTETSRCLCRDTVVYGRYSVFPLYEDLEQDLRHFNSRLINTFDQHNWIANFDYYEDLKDFTFESWTENQFPYSKCEGPFVVKGMTDSKKYNWDTMMYAEDRRAAIEVARRLSQDEMIGRQRIIYRKYVPLVSYEKGLNGLSFTNEWRCFFLGENLLSYGYYWSEAEDVSTPKISEEGLQFARDVAKIASQHVNFFVLDIGEKQEGGWVLVEVNDGQRSGLSMIDPDQFYRNLALVSETFQPA